MKTKNKAQEVNKQIIEMQKKKAADLLAVKEKETEARNALDAALLSMNEAAERMQLEEYKQAESDRKNAQTALDMYGNKYEQIQKQEYISEAESDKTISDLLEYEADIAEEFRTRLVEILKDAGALLKDYRAAVEEAETALNTWTQEIHSNYKSYSGTIYKETGTSRSPRPVPVHNTMYIGCNEAVILKTYLERAGVDILNE